LPWVIGNGGHKVLSKHILCSDGKTVGISIIDGAVVLTQQVQCGELDLRIITLKKTVYCAGIPDGKVDVLCTGGGAVVKTYVAI
jgi:hypothetical protein